VSRYGRGGCARAASKGLHELKLADVAPVGRRPG
jgi:hypothetical protein